VSDDGAIALWRDYVAGGGPTRLGYPVSHRFELMGSVVQVTQRALLVWDPARGETTRGNVLDLFARAGTILGWPGCDTPPATGDAPAAAQLAERCSLATWLEQRGIPPAIEDDGSAGDFRRAIATRLSWLEHPTLRDAFLAGPAGGPPGPWPGEAALAAGLAGVDDDQIPWAAIERYGLPASRPVRYGPFIAQRFQRTVLQLWLDEVPGLPAPGTVTEVLAGELLREAGLIPAAALIPVTLDGALAPPPDLPEPPGPPAPVASPTPPAGATPTAGASPAPGAGPPLQNPAPTPVSAQPTPTMSPDRQGRATPGRRRAPTAPSGARGRARRRPWCAGSARGARGSA
jgi:hypothetical protein